MFQQSYRLHLDTGRKFKRIKTLRRRPESLFNFNCTFNLRPVSRGQKLKTATSFVKIIVYLSLSIFLKFTNPCFHPFLTWAIYWNSFQKVHVKDLISNVVHLSRTEAVARRCSVKKVFLKISRNSQENICVGVKIY